MKKFILGLIFLLFSFSAMAEILEMDSDLFSEAEATTGEEAVGRARDAIPGQYLDHSNWTSPLLSCGLGFRYKEQSDTCENSMGHRSPVIAWVTIRRAE